MQHKTATNAQQAAIMLVTVMLLLSMGTAVIGKAPQNPIICPGTPHAVTGHIYLPNGSAASDTSIVVTITNNRSHESGTDCIDAFGVYQIDLSNGAFYPGGYLATDVIFVNSTHANMMSCNVTTAAGPISVCDLHMIGFPFGPQYVTQASGGSITGYNNSVTLDVPTGAMPSDLFIYGIYPLDAKPGAFASISLGPDGLTFGSPATLTWSYQGLDLGGIPEETLAIYTSDGAAWEKLPCYVDTVANAVVAQVSHFSNFSLGGASAFGSQVGLVNVYPGTPNAPILDLTVINTMASDDTLDYINVISNSTDDADISGISLWNDLDNNQEVGPGDAQIGVTLPVGASNFTMLGVNIPAGSALDLLVAVDVSGTAVAGNHLDLYIPAAGMGLANAGLLEEPIDPSGNATVAANPGEPHAIYGTVRNMLGLIPNVCVNITNNRTGTVNFTMTDIDGRYEVDLGWMQGGYMDNDTIFVQANDTYGQTGWNSVVVNASYWGERCDVYLGRGPIAGNETPANGSIVFDVLVNATVNITSSPLSLNLTTIVLEVEGINYTIADACLSFLGDTLTFNTSAVGAWTDGQIVNVTLWQANDTAGNPCQNAPYSWWFQVSLGVVEHAPDIYLHKLGADINITWAPVANATSYNIYRSLAVNGTGFNFTAPWGVTAEPYFLDIGALADTNNYSYIVRGNSAGGEGPKSNIGWKLRKQLVENAATTDINWIALPYNSDLKFAQDLINDLGGATNVNSISRWVAATQSYQNKLPVGGANWPITPGEGLLVNMKASLIYTVIGSYNNTTMVNLIENAATTDINWIALPYHSQLKFAQDLINNLGGAININSISRWVATTQSYQNKLPVGGANWPIIPGDAILVNVKLTISNYNMGPVQYP